MAFKQIVEWLGPHVSSLPQSAAALKRSCSELPTCWLAACSWGHLMGPAVPTEGRSEALASLPGQLLPFGGTRSLCLESVVLLRLFLDGTGVEALGGQKQAC